MTLLDAISNGNYDETLQALEGGEDPNQFDEYGHSYLYIAVEFNYYEIAKLLLQFGADPNLGSMFPLYNTIYEDKPLFAKLLLENKARPNITNKAGASPLHIATFFSNVDIVNMLVQAGANPNLQNRKGNTPLHYAVYGNNYFITKILKENGANWLIKDVRDKTALDYAKFFCQKNILELFV